MNTRDASMGAVAVDIATNGEDANVNKVNFKVDWSEFWHFIGIWIVTWVILFFCFDNYNNSKMWNKFERNKYNRRDN